MTTTEMQQIDISYKQFKKILAAERPKYSHKSYQPMKLRESYSDCRCVIIWIRFIFFVFWLNFEVNRKLIFWGDF